MTNWFDWNGGNWKNKEPACLLVDVGCWTEWNRREKDPTDKLTRETSTIVCVYVLGRCFYFLSGALVFFLIAIWRVLRDGPRYISSLLFWWFISFFGSEMIISVTQRGCGSLQNRRRRVGHEIHSQFLSYTLRRLRRLEHTILNERKATHSTETSHRVV